MTLGFGPVSVLSLEPNLWQNAADGSPSDGTSGPANPQPRPAAGHGYRDATSTTNAEHGEYDGPVCAELADDLVAILSLHSHSYFDSTISKIRSTASITAYAARRSGMSMTRGPANTFGSDQGIRGEDQDPDGYFTNRNLERVSSTRAYASLKVFHPGQSNETDEHVVIDVNSTTLAVTVTRTAAFNGPAAQSADNIDVFCAIDGTRVLINRADANGNRLSILTIAADGTVAEAMSGGVPNALTLVSAQINNSFNMVKLRENRVLLLASGAAGAMSRFAVLDTAGTVPTLIELGNLPFFFDESRPDCNRYVQEGLVRMVAYSAANDLGSAELVYPLGGPLQPGAFTPYVNSTGAELGFYGNHTIANRGQESLAFGQRVLSAGQEGEAGADVQQMVLYRGTQANLGLAADQSTPQFGQDHDLTVKALSAGYWLVMWRESNTAAYYQSPDYLYYDIGQHQNGLYVQVVSTAEPVEPGDYCDLSLVQKVLRNDLNLFQTSFVTLDDEYGLLFLSNGRLQFSTQVLLLKANEVVGDPINLAGFSEQTPEGVNQLYIVAVAPRAIVDGADRILLYAGQSINAAFTEYTPWYVTALRFRVTNGQLSFLGQSPYAGPISPGPAARNYRCAPFGPSRYALVESNTGPTPQFATIGWDGSAATFTAEQTVEVPLAELVPPDGPVPAATQPVNGFGFGSRADAWGGGDVLLVSGFGYYQSAAGPTIGSNPILAFRCTAGAWTFLDSWHAPYVVGTSLTELPAASARGLGVFNYLDQTETPLDPDFYEIYFDKDFGPQTTTFWVPYRMLVFNTDTDELLYRADFSGNGVQGENPTIVVNNIGGVFQGGVISTEQAEQQGLSSFNANWNFNVTSDTGTGNRVFLAQVRRTTTGAIWTRNAVAYVAPRTNFTTSDSWGRSGYEQAEIVPPAAPSAGSTWVGGQPYDGGSAFFRLDTAPAGQRAFYTYRPAEPAFNNAYHFVECELWGSDGGHVIRGTADLSSFWLLHRDGMDYVSAGVRSRRQTWPALLSNDFVEVEVIGRYWYCFIKGTDYVFEDDRNEEERTFGATDVQGSASPTVFEDSGMYYNYNEFNGLVQRQARYANGVLTVTSSTALSVPEGLEENTFRVTVDKLDQVHMFGHSRDPFAGYRPDNGFEAEVYVWSTTPEGGERRALAFVDTSPFGPGFFTRSVAAIGQGLVALGYNDPTYDYFLYFIGCPPASQHGKLAFFAINGPPRVAIRLSVAPLRGPTISAVPSQNRALGTASTRAPRPPGFGPMKGGGVLVYPPVILRCITDDFNRPDEPLLLTPDGLYTWQQRDSDPQFQFRVTSNRIATTSSSFVSMETSRAGRGSIRVVEFPGVQNFTVTLAQAHRSDSATNGVSTFLTTTSSRIFASGDTWDFAPALVPGDVFTWLIDEDGWVAIYVNGVQATYSTAKFGRPIGTPMQFNPHGLDAGGFVSIQPPMGVFRGFHADAVAVDGAVVGKGKYDDFSWHEYGCPHFTWAPIGPP